MKSVKLLFVHVPKCGGSSIREAVRRQFGERLFVDDDAPADPTSLMNIDPDGFLERYHGGTYDFLMGVEAVTGHLWIRKYDPVKADIRAVILRHPVERTISHYFYWRKLGRPEQPLRKHLLTAELDIVRFARLPIIRWFYTRQFFRDTDMGVFDYVGNYSDLEKDWAGVMRRLSLDHPPVRVNETREISPDYPSRYDEIARDPRTMATLRDLLVDDINFYERACARS
jgi:hypothetical protein